MIKPWKPILCLLLTAVWLPAAQADNTELKSILRHVLTSDPRLLEARANVSVAEEQVKISQAGHYPTVSLTGRQALAQHYENSRDESRETNIGLHGLVNLYAWGGIEAAVNRDRSKHTYYSHKYDETREQLGKTIAELYLTALRAREQIAVYQESLGRHDKMLRDLAVIVRYDSGRRSELSEAQARRLQAESNLLQQQRILQTSLSSLSRYTGTTLQPQDLKDPFAGTTPEDIISRYRNRSWQINPTYLAQKAELDSARAQVEVSRARRLPAVNLEGNLNRDTREVFLSLSWSIFDNAARHTVQQDGYSLAAAEAKLQEIVRETTEKSQTATVDMNQSRRRMMVAIQQISAQREVVRAYEAQFKIARRSLVDVLDAYLELSNIQIAEVNAYGDFSDAALAYLTAQAAVSEWAGVSRADPAQRDPQQILNNNQEPATAADDSTSATTQNASAAIALLQTSTETNRPTASANPAPTPPAVAGTPESASDTTTSPAIPAQPQSTTPAAATNQTQQQNQPMVTPTPTASQRQAPAATPLSLTPMSSAVVPPPPQAPAPAVAVPAPKPAQTPAPAIPAVPEPKPAQTTSAPATPAATTSAPQTETGQTLTPLPVTDTQSPPSPMSMPIPEELLQAQP